MRDIDDITLGQLLDMVKKKGVRVKIIISQEPES